jgi:AraC family transcriptional regulator, arabinose operon regulatory protein
METLESIIQAKVNDCAKFICRPDWHWDTLTGFNDFDLWTILNGRGMLHTPNATYNFNRGDCFLLRPGERYIGEHDPQNPLIVIYIHFNYVDYQGENYLPEQESIPRLHRRIGEFSFFERLLEKTADCFQSSAKYNYAANNWLRVVLQEMAVWDLNIESAGSEIIQRTLIENVCDRIKKDPGHNYTIRELAKENSFSQDYFCRLFKKYVNITPHTFISDIRIDNAKQLLISSNHPVTRIAEILGYNDIYHFSKRFQEKTGMSPMAFRKSWKYAK